MKAGLHRGAFSESGDDRDDGDWTIGADQKAALGSYYLRGDATTGSYLVPTAYANEIVRVSSQASVVLPRVTRIPMSAREMKFARELLAPNLTWVTDETTAKTEAESTFDPITLTAKTLAAYVGVTDELLEDSSVVLQDHFLTLFSEAFGREADKQVLVADTAPFIGLTKNTSCNAVTMAPGMTSFANVKYEDLLALENAISVAKGEVALNNSVFVMHRKVLNYLRAKKDDNGQPLLWRASEGAPATLMGRPVVLSDQMPSADAVSTGFIILGDLKNVFYGDRVGLEFRVYDQTSYGLTQDQVFFRARIRAAFLCAIPAAFAVLKTPGA
jgi:HK97 family phage major capsid protein